MEYRKQKQAAFSITQKLEVLRYKDLHHQVSQQAVADHFVFL